MLSKIRSLLATVGVGVAIGIMLLVATAFYNPQRSWDNASEIVLPKTSAELINKAQLIFIGKIGPVVQHRTFSGYGPKGELLDGVDTAGHPAPKVPITDFTLKVEQVIKDDGSIAGGKPIILRMGGDATPEMKNLTLKSDYPFSYQVIAISFYFLLNQMVLPMVSTTVPGVAW